MRLPFSVTCALVAAVLVPTGPAAAADALNIYPARVDPKLVQTYESLADPKLKGKICMRSSSAIYNLSLMGALYVNRLV